MKVCCKMDILNSTMNYTKFNSMNSMMKQYNLIKSKIIALPYFLESSAVVSAPLEYVRILETGGKQCAFSLCDSATLKKRTNLI